MKAQNNIILRFAELILFCCCLLLSIGMLFLLKEQPKVALICAQYFMLMYLVFFSQNKYFYVVFLFPIIIVGLSFFFTQSYKDLGDGTLYFAQSEYVLNSVNNQGFFSTLELSWSQGWDYFFVQYHEVGFFPVHWIPDTFFPSNVNNIEYFFSQTYFHVILVCFLFYLNQRWKILIGQERDTFFLFLLFSPTFLELNAAPTRHIFTFFLVALFFFSIITFFQKKSIDSFLILSLSIILTLVNKPAYLLTFSLFIFYYNFALISLRYKIIIGTILLLLSAPALPYVMELLKNYSEFATSSSSSFSYNSLFLIWPFFKFFIALLAPFPWYKWNFFVDTIYGGNHLMFFLHLLSSITGLLFVYHLFYIKKKSISLNSKLMIVYAGIMCLSILFGETGFHSYIAIFFPFLTPLLQNGNKKPLFIIVIFAFLANVLAFAFVK